MPTLSDDPAWDGARNLADLGGLPLVLGGHTIRGRVFRSARPEWMTDSGWDDARAAGLTTVVDLRNDVERGREDEHPPVGPAALAGITVAHAPTEDPDDERFLAECGHWLDHPRSWTPNLRLFPDRIARVLTAIARSEGAVLIHCAGGRDRTGMIGSMLLALAGATPDAIVANYESGFRGAGAHRGHGWAYDSEAGEWRPHVDEPATEDQLVAALVDRRGDLFEWIATTDVPAYLLDAGAHPDDLRRLQRLLIA